MSRAAAIARAHGYFDSGEFLVDLRRRVAIPSTSQEPERAGALRGYLEDEMVPSLAPLGFTSRILDNPLGPAFLVAERIEDEALLTVLIYGHGDTVRGLDDLWRPGLSPWVLTVEGPRIYGRGTADNVYIVKRGHGTLTADGKTYVIRENDVVYIPAGMTHSLANLSEDVFEIFEIYAPSGSHFDFVLDE